MPEKGMKIEQAMFSNIFVVSLPKRKKIVTVITRPRFPCIQIQSMRYIFTEFSLPSRPPGFNINP